MKLKIVIKRSIIYKNYVKFEIKIFQRHLYFIKLKLYIFKYKMETLKQKINNER